MSYKDFNQDDTINMFRLKMRELQSPNKYKLTLEYGPLGVYHIYPDLITIPEKNIVTLEYSTSGYTREIPTNGQTGKLLVSFIMLKDMSFINYIEKWMEKIAGTSTRIQDAQLQTVIPYGQCVGSVNITMFSAFLEIPTKIYYSDEIYPISIQPIEVSSGSTGYLTANILFYVRCLTDNTRDRSSTASITQTQTINQ